MRRIFVVMGALLLLVALAGAQGNVIKYSLQCDGEIPIGRVVKLGTTAGHCVVANADDDDDVIGFVAMLETDGTNTFALIVNSGMITARCTTGVSISKGDDITVDNNGYVKPAETGDRVIGVATEDATGASDVDVMINLEPMPGENGAKIWQAAIGSEGSPVSLTATANTDLATITLPANAGCENVAIYFTGTVDDRTGSGGAVVKLNLTETDNTDEITSIIYLIDRNFYQSQSVALSKTDDVAPNNSAITYYLEGWTLYGLNNGRIWGILTMIGTPR